MERLYAVSFWLVRGAANFACFLICFVTSKENEQSAANPLKTIRYVWWQAVHNDCSTECSEA